MAGKKSRRYKKRAKTCQKIKTPPLIPIKKEVEETYYVCNVCKKRFRQESTFQLHRLIHNREQTFSCDICKEEFPFLSRLQKHCLLKHSNDLLVVGQDSDQVGNKNTKPFTCDICDKGFLVHYALKKHLSCAHEKNDNGIDEELLPSLTPPKNSDRRNLAVSSNNSNSNNDSSRVCKQTETGSAELSVKMESDISCNNSATSWNEVLSSSPKRNQNNKLCGDFWKKDLSTVYLKPDRSAELCIKVESESFDPKEACVALKSEESSCDKGSADSSGPLNAPVEPEKQFCCPICNMKFVKKCYLQGHFRTHESTPADYTPRFTSDRPLPSQPSGALGVLNIGPYICETCHKGFVKNEDFQMHCLTHSEQNTYTCKVCSKQFARYGNFRAHCETHMKKSTFICDICGTNFQIQKHLIDHQQMQSANAKLKCEFCNKKFDQACSLIIHEQTHRGFHCEDCGSVFSVAGALKRHQRSHAYKSKCGVCARTFATNNSLRQHLKTHFGSKIYRCETCNEEFGFKHHLRIHRTTHRDDMPHTCQLCNEGFLHAWSLRNHLLEHEANQDVEMWQNCSLDTAENVENLEAPGKVMISETFGSYDEKIKNIKKEKDC